MEKRITSLGELNAFLDEYKRENGKPYYTPPSIGVGSLCQVSLDGTDRYYPALVLKVEGDGIMVEMTNEAGQKMWRSNVRHATDPVVATDDYRDLWGQTTPDGGIWKHSDNDADLRAQLADLKSQLAELRGDKPDSSPVTPAENKPVLPPVKKKSAQEQLLGVS